MARNDIFQILLSKRDFDQEVTRLETLLANDRAIAVFERNAFDFADEPEPQYFKIEEFVNKYAFLKWKCRGTYINLSELITTLGLEDMRNGYCFTEEQLLLYAEYVANVLYLAEHVETSDVFWYHVTDVFEATKKNLNSILEWLNYEQKLFYKKEKVLIFQKNAAVIAAAEVVKKDLALSIIEYNHNSLKGNLEGKKSILLALGEEIEPKRQDIRDLDHALADGIFFLLNNINLRHNNRSKGNNNNYKEYIAKLNNTTLESWYDELYQMMLLAFLELEQRDRNKKVENLKNILKEGNRNGSHEI